MGELIVINRRLIENEHMSFLISLWKPRNAFTDQAKTLALNTHSSLILFEEHNKIYVHKITIVINLLNFDLRFWRDYPLRYYNLIIN